MSELLIIDKTKPLPPILEHREKPVFRTEYEREKYWAKEKEKWVEGVGEIPGTLYFKTQELWIKNRNTGKTFRPECRDVDLLIHQYIRDQRKKGHAGAIIKGRGIGLSSEFGCLANYFMRVYPGSTSLFTSAEQSKISDLFNAKVMIPFNKYDPDIKPRIVRENNTKNSVYLRAEIKYRDEFGQVALEDSEVFCKETADSDASASGFSGRGAIFGAYDELFLHKRRSLLLKSSSPCFVEQGTGRVTGFLLAGGSIEETLTNDELSLLREMVEDIQENKRLGTIPAELLFLPAWMGRDMVNGHSDEKKGREWWAKECEELSRMNDKTALRAFRMNHPMDLTDIFELTSGAAYEDDVSDMLKATLEKIKLKPPVIQHCNLAKVGDNIQTIPSTKPNVHILETPKQGLQYWLLVDGTGTGTKTGSEDGSETCGLVVCGFNPHGASYIPVGYVLQRFPTVEQSYIALVNLFRYYNIHNGMVKICAEGNIGTSDHFSTFLEKEGLGKYIQMRKDLSGKGNSEKTKPFQYVGIDEIEFQYRFMNIFLRKYGHNIQFATLIQDMLRPKNVPDADMRSAFNMFSIALPTNYDKPVEYKKPLNKGRYVIVQKDGITEWKWVGDKPEQNREYSPRELAEQSIQH